MARYYLSKRDCLLINARRRAHVEETGESVWMARDMRYDVLWRISTWAPKVGVITMIGPQLWCLFCCLRRRVG